MVIIWSCEVDLLYVTSERFHFTGDYIVMLNTRMSCSKKLVLLYAPYHLQTFHLSSPPSKKEICLFLFLLVGQLSSFSVLESPF